MISPLRAETPCRSIRGWYPKYLGVARNAPRTPHLGDRILCRCDNRAAFIRARSFALDHSHRRTSVRNRTRHQAGITGPTARGGLVLAHIGLARKAGAGTNSTCVTTRIRIPSTSFSSGVTCTCEGETNMNRMHGVATDGVGGVFEGSKAN